jgi:hypothetical protein
MRASLPLVFGLCTFLAACGSDSTSTFGDDAGKADGALDGPGGGDATEDGNLPFLPDAATTDGPACNVLNIGILGNPGANPSSNFQTWLTNAGTTVKRIQTTSAALTAQEIAPYNVLVLDWLQHDYTPAEAALVKAFVEAGGGLVSMTGYNGSTTDFRANAILGELGVSYGGALVSGPVTTFVSHPITAGLTSITFAGGYVVSETGAPPYTRTPIASIPAGKVAYAIQAAKGRAFVWGDEWIEFDSEWTQLPEVKKLWVQIFAWVAPNGCPLTPN